MGGVLSEPFRFSGRFLLPLMSGSGTVLRFGPFELDVAQHSLRRAGQPIALTPKVFELLALLAESGGRLLEKDVLMKAVWPETVVEEGNLTKGIFLLRQALGDTKDARLYVATVPKVGYRFVAEVERVEGPAPTAAAGAARSAEVERGGETHYAKSGDVHIAYQVVGQGPLDLVLVPGWVSHLESAWEHPALARFLKRLASFARLILIDRRGTGLSDRVTEVPSLEERMDDVRAVMDAAGSEHAALFGISEGGPMCILFAATYPERTRSLVLFGTAARIMRSDDYPIGIPEDRFEDFAEHIAAGWGTGVSIDVFAPSVADDAAFRRAWGRIERFSASPAGIKTLMRMLYETDVREVLPSVRVPTLVVHRSGDLAMRADGARHIADHIPGARYVELAGDDHFPWVGDGDALVDEVEEFLTGSRTTRDVDRVLTTILFTDIADSTERAAELGDQRWRDLLASHDALVREELGRFRGHEVKQVGDGFLATFDGPARGIRCARAIRDAVRALGIEIRAGLHTGECEYVGNDVGGIAVHIGARVAASARPGEVLVSGTVRDLVAGSGLRFDDRGTHRLRGVPGEWRLFAVEE
jgi:class 3 adenylate cyclase/DNA-binding winged helix-turn-helix (wHTH) protein